VSRNLAEWLLEVGAPHDVALIDEQGAYTYGELREDVDRVAQSLLSRGFAKGTPIGLLAANGRFFVATYLGTMHAGLCSVPLLTNAQPGYIRASVARTRMPAILVESRHASRLDDAGLGRDPERIGEEILRTRCATRQEPYAIDAARDVAAIIFTSGSTGEPKGVMISHGNIQTNTSDIIHYMSLSSADRVMAVLPFSYCYGASLLHTHLRVGGSVAASNQFTFAERVLDAIETHRCTGFAGVPATYQYLARRSHFLTRDLPSLRWLQQAGGKLANALIQEVRDAHPGVRFFVMYGQTEATARLSYLPPDMLDSKLGSIGRGLPSTTLRVLREDGSEVARGGDEVGEIVAEGPNVALGYFEDEEETAKHFQHGMLRTGDLARVDRDGYVFIVDRARSFIKCMGYRVSPTEVEEVLLSHPDVTEAAVFGAPDDTMGERIVAAVTAGGACRADSLTQHCRGLLPNYMIPAEIHVVDSLPKTETGKLDRHALKQRLFA
jgi:acyl-CoA synthetase (AMP-forming)/AMP-acid ligase II